MTSSPRPPTGIRLTHLEGDPADGVDEVLEALEVDHRPVVDLQAGDALDRHDRGVHAGVLRLAEELGVVARPGADAVEVAALAVEAVAGTARPSPSPSANGKFGHVARQPDQHGPAGLGVDAGDRHRVRSQPPAAGAGVAAEQQHVVAAVVGAGRRSPSPNIVIMKSRWTPTRWAPKSSDARDGQAEDAVEADHGETLALLQAERLAEPPGVHEQRGPADREPPSGPAAAGPAAAVFGGQPRRRSRARSAARRPGVTSADEQRPNQIRRAIRPTRLLPATSWAEPGSSSVISIRVTARRNRTRAARSALAARGRWSWSSSNPGEGRAASRCLSCWGSAVSASITSHTRHRGRDAPRPGANPPPRYRLGHERRSPGRRRPRGGDARVRLALRRRAGRAGPTRTVTAADAERRLRPTPTPPACCPRCRGRTAPGLPPPPASDPAPGSPARRSTGPRPDPAPRPGRRGRRRRLGALGRPGPAGLGGVPGRRAARGPGPRSARSTPSRPASGPPSSRARRTSSSAATPVRACSKAERQELGTGNAAGQRTDTIMLLHTGVGAQPADVDPPRLAGRDPRARRAPRSTPPSRTAVPSCWCSTIEDNTGIRIDHYVEIGFGGFVGVVDAVGGIEICPTTDMKDPLANLDIKKGCQQADGVTALGYARSRHSDPQYGDITRAEHQREVVSAVGDEVVSPWSVLNPVRYFRRQHRRRRVADGRRGHRAVRHGAVRARR